MNLKGAITITSFNDFTNPESWTGSFYELSIEFHKVGNNKRLNDALVALQNHNSFQGIWKEREMYQKQTLDLPIEIEVDSVTNYYGMLDVTKDISLPCQIILISTEGESDWLDIAIPSVVFEKTFALEYPLIKELNPWIASIDETFIKLAEVIYAHSAFNLALIGEEVSGMISQQEITLERMDGLTTILPLELQKRLRIEGIGQQLSDSLRVYEEGCVDTRNGEAK